MVDAAIIAKSGELFRGSLKLTITKDLEAFARVISEKVTVKVVYESGYGERCELVSAPKT